MGEILESLFSFMLTAFLKLIATRTSKLLMLACLLAIAMSMGATQLHPANAQWVVTSVTQTKASAAPAPASPVTTATSSKPAYTLNCTPATFSTPSQLNLDDAGDGLTVQNDSPAQYQIYGNAAMDLTKQIQHCAPGANGSASAEFTAQTDYRLSWQYYLVQDNAGCHLTDVKVGLHTAVIMPLWQPSTSVTAGLASRWHTFYASLLTHEQGHVAIDQQYAGELLADLQAIDNQSCSTITATVTGVTNTDTGRLGEANDAYDTNTDHGATQGAVLPVY